MFLHLSVLDSSLLFTAAQQAGRPVCIQGDAHMTFMTVCVISLIYLHSDYLFMKLYLGGHFSVDDLQVDKEQTEKKERNFGK